MACLMRTSLLVFLATSVSLAAEADLSRRSLEHQDYDVWNTLTTTDISRDGKWVIYGVRSGKADGEQTLKVRSTSSPKEYVIERGTDHQFSYDSRFAFFRITPDKKKVKELQKAKTKPDQMPKAKLQILELASGQVVTVEGVKSFALPELNGDWLAYLLDKPVDGENVEETKSDVLETYQVTPQGLKRPEKAFKLKKREPPPHHQSIESQRQEPKQKPSQGKSEATPSERSKEKNPGDSGAKSENKKKAAGTRLVLQNLDSGVRQSFPNVNRYLFSKHGKGLAYVTSVEAEQDETKKTHSSQNNDRDASKKSTGKTPSDTPEPSDGVHLIDLDSLQHIQVAMGPGEYKGLAFNEDGSRLAFISNSEDYQAESPSWSLYHWKTRDKEAARIAAEGDKGVPQGWWIATNSDQQFSEDGRRLYFETAPVPESVIKERDAPAKSKSKKVADEDDEQAKLDIWHWQDPQLQPQQLLMAEFERKRDYRAAYNLKSKQIVQLATGDVPDIRIDYRSRSPIAVAVTNMEYRKTLSWDIPGFKDTYLVNLDTGKRQKVQERVKWSASMSPQGKFIIWFDAAQRKWFSQSTSDKSQPVEMSAGIKTPLQDELHDQPSLARAYGTAGWIKDDLSLLIYDRFDIWKVDPTGKNSPVRLTTGREKKIRFRYVRLDRKEREIDPAKAIVLSAFNETNKASGYFQLALNDKTAKNAKKNDAVNPEGVARSPLRQLIMLDESVSRLRKAETTDDLVFTRNTFRHCPDLWSSDLGFKEIHRVSDINPQQDQYVWGSSKLVHWTTTDGQPLDGILYQPDGFDPTKKYPMLVYFYERNSDRLHSYYTPAARTSINHSFYVSRGYLVFVPDIPYKTGEPGASAANAILPGVKSLIEEGYVDEKRIGMQGHSWGGYQAAYLVTQTDMFACAESGAPVSNMTSAYGGIRWSSGMSRMFQYERSQSRIGENLWTAREKYIANSPLFFADKINTPLLILHNDEDGAVPWYQGIELFVALRRLEKPAWMLNYNGNPHGVTGEPNRRDFATRMQQFFDHYLKGAPEPEWMAVGVPAVDKGKNFGLDLMEPKPADAAAGKAGQK